MYMGYKLTLVITEVPRSEANRDLGKCRLATLLFYQIKAKMKAQRPLEFPVNYLL